MVLTAAERAGPTGGSTRSLAVIVRSTIDLGHGPGLSVVAEGVEGVVTYAALAALGCDRIQGHHVARPMRETRLTSWMDASAVPRQVRA